MPSTAELYNQEVLEGHREALAALRELLAAETDPTERRRLANAILKTRQVKLPAPAENAPTHDTSAAPPARSAPTHPPTDFLNPLNPLSPLNPLQSVAAELPDSLSPAPQSTHPPGAQ